MVHWRALTGAVLALAAGPMAQAQSSPAGLWKTISDVDGKPRGLVQLSVAADGLVSGAAVGTLVAGEDPNRVCDKCPGELKGKPLRGMRILWGLKPAPGKPGQWIDGKVIDPDRGGVYSARLTLSADGQSLVLRGYLGTAALGRSQTWRRAPADQALQP